MLPAYHWPYSNGTGLIVKAVPEINNTKYQCEITTPQSGKFLLPQSNPAHLFIVGTGTENIKQLI